MEKYQLHALVRSGAISLSVAIKMQLHPDAHDGYAAPSTPDLTDLPEEFEGGFPVRSGPGFLRPHTLGNGTATFAQGTNTYYAWPVPS
jgi:hypothetical protein